jgi:hypothetical protein
MRILVVPEIIRAARKPTRREIGSMIDPIAASLAMLGSSACIVSRISSGENWNEADDALQAKRAVLAVLFGVLWIQDIFRP